MEIGQALSVMRQFLNQYKAAKQLEEALEAAEKLRFAVSGLEQQRAQAEASLTEFKAGAEKTVKQLTAETDAMGKTKQAALDALEGVKKQIAEKADELAGLVQWIAAHTEKLNEVEAAVAEANRGYAVAEATHAVKMDRITAEAQNKKNALEAAAAEKGKVLAELDAEIEQKRELLGKIQSGLAQLQNIS